MASTAVAITRFHSVGASCVDDHCLMPMTIVLHVVASVVISSGQRYWFQP